jgi:hypothetical protein
LPASTIAKPKDQGAQSLRAALIKLIYDYAQVELAMYF